MAEPVGGAPDVAESSRRHPSRRPWRRRRRRARPPASSWPRPCGRRLLDRAPCRRAWSRRKSAAAATGSTSAVVERTRETERRSSCRTTRRSPSACARISCEPSVDASSIASTPSRGYVWAGERGRHSRSHSAASRTTRTTRTGRRVVGGGDRRDGGGMWSCGARMPRGGEPSTGPTPDSGRGARRPPSRRAVRRGSALLRGGLLARGRLAPGCRLLPRPACAGRSSSWRRSCFARCVVFFRRPACAGRSSSWRRSSSARPACAGRSSSSARPACACRRLLRRRLGRGLARRRLLPCRRLLGGGLRSRPACACAVVFFLAVCHAASLPYVPSRISGVTL